MGKIFTTKEKKYSYGVAEKEYRKIERKSRWIHVDYLYITKKHSLWDYVDKYDIEEDGKACLICFRHGGRLYALDQFMRLSYPIFFEDETGKEAFLSGYDCTDYYNPYLIEIEDGGEYIRLYQEVL